MSRQTRVSTHPLTPTIWSKKFMEYSLEENFFGRMGLIGEDEKSMIRIYRDLEVSKGNKVRVPMLGPLSGVGGGDNFNSEDILEAYDEFYQDVEVHERGHATANSGPMTRQHMIEDWPEIATRALAGWKGVIEEREIINALCGLYNLSTDVESINEHAPTSKRIAYGGETAAGVIDPLSALADGTKLGTYVSGTVLTTDALLSADTTSDCLMGPYFLERCVQEYLDIEPRPQPLTIEGRRGFLLIMTPGQAYDMRHNAIYIARNTYADVRGSKNPMLSDSLGWWNCGEVSVLLKSYGRMPQRTGAGGTTPSEGFTLYTDKTYTTDPVASGDTVGRALLVGAQAGAIAYGGADNGQLFKRFKGDLDSGTGRKPLHGVDWIYGVSKTIFKDEGATAQQDFATMCLDTMHSS